MRDRTTVMMNLARPPGLTRRTTDAFLLSSQRFVDLSVGVAQAHDGRAA